MSANFRWWKGHMISLEYLHTVSPFLPKPDNELYVEMTEEDLSSLVENLTLFSMNVIFVFLFCIFFFLNLVIFKSICCLRKMKNCKEI